MKYNIIHVTVLKLFFVSILKQLRLNSLSQDQDPRPEHRSWDQGHQDQDFGPVTRSADEVELKQKPTSTWLKIEDDGNLERLRESVN